MEDRPEADLEVWFDGMCISSVSILSPFLIFTLKVVLRIENNANANDCSRDSHIHSYGSRHDQLLIHSHNLKRSSGPLPRRPIPLRHRYSRLPHVEHGCECQRRTGVHCETARESMAE